MLVYKVDFVDMESFLIAARETVVLFNALDLDKLDLI